MAGSDQHFGIFYLSTFMMSIFFLQIIIILNIALYKDPKNVIPIWMGSEGGVRVAPEWHTPSQSYYMAWGTLTMFEATVCGRS